MNAALRDARTVVNVAAGGGSYEPENRYVSEAGAERFAVLDAEHFEEVAGQVDVVLDTVGRDVLDRSAAVVRPGGTLVSVTAPPKVRPADGRAVFFVLESNRDQLTELARRVQRGKLTPKVGAVRPLTETRDAFLRKRGIPGKIIIQVA